MKISVLNFQKYRVTTYRFRKILAWYTKLSLSHWVHLFFALNARGYVNVGTEILSHFTCEFTKTGPLLLLFFKDFVIF